MILAFTILAIFAWFGISIWWVIRHAGNDKSPEDTLWNNFQVLPVLVVLWIIEQARKAKKNGVK